MILWRLIPELPLLKRELTELAARRRTYVVRTVGAVVILSLAVYFVAEALSGYLGNSLPGQRNMASKILGAGAIAFPRLIWLLFPAIQILMPSMTCGSITIEKERNTIGTLFVTRLSPMTIVLEKLGSRLIPMLSVLILTFPMLAFVYSLGGVDQTLLKATIWLILWECLLYASIGLLCSAWYSTTVGAFVASYVLTGVLFTVTVVLNFGIPTPFRLWVEYSRGMMMGGGRGGFLQTLATMGYPLWGVFLATIPVMLFVVCALLLTRFLLFRRAFVSQSSLLLKIFRRVDFFFHNLNQQAGGVIVFADRESFPESDPVAWREREKKSLGKARYLVRILMVLELPVLLICLWTAIDSSGLPTRGLSQLLLVIWAVVAMIVAMKASTLLSSERARETMEALLSTPMTGASILRQKIMGMHRLMMVLAAPLLSVHLTLILMYMNFSLSFTSGMLFQLFLLLMYGGLSVLSTWMLMNTIAWVSVLCGARCTTQARSVMTAMVVVGGWICLSWTVFAIQRNPLVYDQYAGANLVGVYGRNYDPAEIGLAGRSFLRLLRIDGAIQANDELLTSITSAAFRTESGRYYREAVENPVAEILFSLLVVVWHVGLCWGVRWIALRRSSRLLGRNDENLSTEQLFPAGLQAG